MEEQAARKALRAWLVGRGNVPADALKDDRGLVADGVINSFDVFELITLLESLRGRPVDMGALSGDEFRSVDSLIASFFKDAP